MASMTPDALIAWIASLPPAARDAAAEGYLGIDAEEGAAFSSAPPGDELVGYHAAGVAPIVHMAIEVPIAPSDVVIDLGAGLGKVVALAHLLTGASARGVELQPSLVSRARAMASHLAIDVRFDCADAREADLDDGTVFFLYAPFTGPVLREVAQKLRAVAEHHAIVVGVLGIDLPRDTEKWLRPRSIDSFWLSIFDSVVPGVAPRPAGSSPLGPRARDIAFERVSASAALPARFEGPT